MSITLTNKQIISSIGAIDILDQKGELTMKGRFALAKNRRKLADMAEDFHKIHKAMFKDMFGGKINDIPPTHEKFPDYDARKDELMAIANPYDPHQIEAGDIEKLPQGGAGALAELDWLFKGGLDALLNGHSNGKPEKAEKV